MLCVHVCFRLVVFSLMTIVCIVTGSIQVAGLCFGIGVEYCDSSVSKYYDDT